MKEEFELPEWILEKVRAEYTKEILALIEEGEVAFISPGWHGSDVNLTLVVGEKTVLVNKFSLEELCDEPAKHWHNNGKTDQVHYDLVKSIADSLKVQSDRLYAVHKTLTVREP